MLESAHPLAISGIITVAIGLVVLLTGYMQARKKNYKKHRQLMILAVITLALFLIQYLFRLGVLREETRFEGDESIRNYVYLPILVIHISFALITLGLINLHGRRTLNNEQFTESGVPYFPKEYRLNHRALGLRVFIFWLISYLGGVIVFVLLYLI
jgi:putative membrane protein